jgi:FMNH2-dependent dimethyl sulfone monooxygenase
MNAQMNSATMALDAPVAKSTNPVLDGGDFKLALFCLNSSRGSTVSHADTVPKATWAESVRVAAAADRAGIDAIIPLARWKNWVRGPLEYDRCFESFTWAAGLAAVTTRAAIFATVHAPLFHPLIVAKMSATVDHISGGRFGINITAGWNETEFAMFGASQREHDERYAYADEWTATLKRLWTSEEPFEMDGAYFHGRELVSQPQPLQKPYPVIMSAGSSPIGRGFAQRHADLNFLAIPSWDMLPTLTATARQEARSRFGREVRLFGHGYVVCADTESAARRRFEDVVRTRRDHEGTRALVEAMMGTSRSIDIFKNEVLIDRAAAGFFALPLVGTPEQVVAGMQRMRDGGLDGMAISFCDYDEGVACYDQAIRPLAIQSGLRSR